MIVSPDAFTAEMNQGGIFVRQPRITSVKDDELQKTGLKIASRIFLFFFCVCASKSNTRDCESVTEM